jgi:integrase
MPLRYGDIQHLTEFLDFEKMSIDPTGADLKRKMKQHGITDQGRNFIQLLLLTGLRKSEALQLKWENVNWARRYLVLHDTKNGRDHFVPLTASTRLVLKRQKTASADRSSPYVFPSRHDDHQPMTEPKSQLAAICKATGLKFTLHDLRRTFATHASAFGMSHDIIKRALNHKSGDVTEGYIVPQIDAIRPVFEKVAEGFFDYSHPGLREELEYEHELDEALQKAIDEGWEPDDKALVMPDRTKR